MNREAQSCLKVLGTITMALVGIVPGIVGVWLVLVTHEIGHAIGYVTSGRAVKARSVVSRVECGPGSSRQMLGGLVCPPMHFPKFPSSWQ
jgi:hypothetical protein